MSRKRKASNLVQGLLARWNRTETVEVDGHPLKLATPSAKAFIDMQVQGAAAMDAVRAEHEEGTSAYTAAVFQAGVDQGIKGLRACVDAADPGQLEGLNDDQLRHLVLSGLFERAVEVANSLLRLQDVDEVINPLASQEGSESTPSG